EVPQPDNPCPPLSVSKAGTGRLSFVDTRIASDPMVVLSVPGDMPMGLFTRPGQIFVTDGARQGGPFCFPPAPPPPPPPHFSPAGLATAEVYGKGSPLGPSPHGNLRIFAGDASGMSLTSTIDAPANLTDVLVVRDVAFVAAGEVGLLIYDVSDPAHPVEV